MQEEYLQILIQCLEKKKSVLFQIRKKNEEQRVLLLDDDLAPEDFERNIDEKGQLIDQLELLDDGFDETYDRVRELVRQHPQQYEKEIKTLQELIREITSDSNSIQAEEQRNYRLAQQKFAAVKQQVREVKASHRVVNQYYQTMNKTNYIDAQFLDNKK